MTTRRDFLGILGLGLGATALGCARAVEGKQPLTRLPHIGLQLYTVRTLMTKDVESTLASVAEIGYDQVEFAGYFKRTPAQIVAALAANHLASPSTHISYPATDDAWKATVDDARARGHEWAVIASVDPSLHKEPGDWSKLAERFNQLGALARERGMKFGYHNHAAEFVATSKGTALDTLLAETDPKLVDFEMDLYWVVKGGGDPLDLIGRYPHRFPLMHAKDASPAPERAIVDVGAGTIDFARIFAQQAVSGMTHVFVEHDRATDPLQSARNSYRYLSALRY